MEGSGNQPLSHAAFPQNQNGSIGIGNLVQDGKDPAHLAAARQGQKKLRILSEGDLLGLSRLFRGL